MCPGIGTQHGGCTFMHANAFSYPPVSIAEGCNEIDAYEQYMTERGFHPKRVSGHACYTFLAKGILAEYSSRGGHKNKRVQYIDILYGLFSFPLIPQVGLRTIVNLMEINQGPPVTFNMSTRACGHACYTVCFRHLLRLGFWHFFVPLSVSCKSTYTVINQRRLTVPCSCYLPGRVAWKHVICRPLALAVTEKDEQHCSVLEHSPVLRCISGRQ